MIIYQTENFGNRFEFRTNPHENWMKPPHIHEYSELAFTREGTTTVYLEGKRCEIPKNHLIFILPNQIHEYSAETSSLMRCAVFSNDHIPALFDRLGELVPAEQVIDMSDSEYLLRELETVDRENTVRICGILNLVCDKLLSSTTLIKKENTERSLFSEAVRYISENFTSNINLPDLAKRLGYHEKYLSAALHSMTGMNFRLFLASYRVSYAKHLLSISKVGKNRMADIASECGFASINTFNRVFKELTGMTPSEYKARKMQTIIC